MALTTFSDLVAEARQKCARRRARRWTWQTTILPLHAGGTGAAAYADAVATYLAFGVSRAADYGQFHYATWLTDDNAIRRYIRPASTSDDVGLLLKANLLR